MSAAALLADLTARGVELAAVEGRLRYRPRPAVTAADVSRLAAHRTELLEILTAGAAPAPIKGTARNGAARLIRGARRAGDVELAATLRDAWRERVAICTLEGELSVRDAERVAHPDLEAMAAPVACPEPVVPDAEPNGPDCSSECDQRRNA